MVMGSIEKFQEAKLSNQQQEKESSSKTGEALSEEKLNTVANKETGGGEDLPIQDASEIREGNEVPSTPRINYSCKGLSDTEFELDKEFEEELFHEDALDNVDPRCISQSTNTLLGKAKGCQGRRSNRQKREDKANEKGIVNVFDFMQIAKGEGLSLGKI
ncbi:hypothetical protein SUGI_0713270 [Cryptomeria japonica]|nr:hypothetical protein SUGI_0713270 [Cryptomeria japonica]